ncbi:hypothetical protein [Streptomyces sp. NPDC021096]|uniref:hypothetical protein n=1 Tax=Streptomyces sp. NPDC021096 TaxID=3154792 RepID=UPI0033F44EDC
MTAWVTARTLPRGPRSRSRVASAFLVVLVALAHVMGCAHGQPPPNQERSYSLPLAAPAPPDRGPGPVALRGSGEDVPRECAEANEAGVAAPRQDLPTATGADLLPQTEADGCRPALPADTHGSAPAPAGDPGRLRAALGVWRT